MRLQNADMGEDMPGDTQALPLLPPLLASSTQSYYPQK